MNRQSWLLLIFAVAFAVLLMSPPYLRYPLPFYPLMELADATDILTPLILIPIYWLLFQSSDETPAGLPAMILFMLFAVLWVQGQGMHLATNSIGHLLKDSPHSNAFTLANFYDETLSHYLWHIGIAGLSALLVWRSWLITLGTSTSDRVAVVFGGIVYGTTFFIITIEGVTVPIGLPFSFVFVAVMLLRARSRLPQQPILMFFTIAGVLSLVLYAAWGLIWGGFPEFSEIGLID
jgi:hypothetical protein